MHHEILLYVLLFYIYFIRPSIESNCAFELLIHVHNTGGLASYCPDKTIGRQLKSKPGDLAGQYIATARGWPDINSTVINPGGGLISRWQVF